MYQAADALSRLRIPEEYKIRVEDDILERGITPSPPFTGEEQATVNYMQGKNTERDKGGFSLPDVYASVMVPESSDEKQPITAQEYIKKQENDSYCSQASYTMGLTGSSYSYDRTGSLRQIAPIHGTVQNVVPTSSQTQLQYQLHNSTLAGHLGETRMDDTMRREHY